jgi:hypothetical protein
LLKPNPRDGAAEPERQRQFGASIPRRKDNIKINLPEIRLCCGLN